MKTSVKHTCYTTAVLGPDSHANITRLKTLAKISKPGDCVIAQMGELTAAGLWCKSTDAKDSVFMLKRSDDKQLPWWCWSRLYRDAENAANHSDNDGGVCSVMIDGHTLFIGRGDIGAAHMYAPGASDVTVVIAGDPVTETLIRRNAGRLCKLALPIVVPDGGSTEVWAGKYGEVLVGADGQSWVGDLCYMHERFGWSNAEYMQAYGYTNYPDPEWRHSPNTTRRLQVHNFRDKYILVIGTGSDGAGPLGLGLDTAAVSFVSTDRARIEVAALACRTVLLTP